MMRELEMPLRGATIGAGAFAGAIRARPARAPARPVGLLDLVRPAAVPGVVALLIVQVWNHSLLDNQSLFSACATVVYALNIMIGFLLVRRKYVLFGAFTLLNLPIPAQMFVFRYLLETPYSNWRAKVMDVGLTYDGLSLINLYLTVIALLGLAFLGRREAVDPDVAGARAAQGLRLSFPAQIGVLAATAAVNLVVLVSFWGANRDAWISEADIGDRFVLRFCSILMAFLFVVCIYARAAVMKFGAVACLGTALVMSAAGFRYLGAMMAMNLAVRFLVSRRLTPRLAALGVAVAALGYIALLSFAYMRQSGDPPARVLADMLTGRVTFEDVAQYAGTNEECTFYTFVFFQGKGICYRGQLYLAALVHQLPYSLWSRITSVLPTGRIIGAYAAPKWFADHDLNLGDYYLTEAFLDFSHAGPFLAILVIFLAFWRIEGRKFAGPYSLICYNLAVSLLYMFVFYGIEIYLKNMLVVVAAAFALRLVAEAGGAAGPRPRPASVPRPSGARA